MGLYGHYKIFHIGIYSFNILYILLGHQIHHYIPELSRSGFCTSDAQIEKKFNRGEFVSTYIDSFMIFSGFPGYGFLFGFRFLYFWRSYPKDFNACELSIDVLKYWFIHKIFRFSGIRFSVMFPVFGLLMVISKKIQRMWISIDILIHYKFVARS